MWRPASACPRRHRVAGGGWRAGPRPHQSAIARQPRSWGRWRRPQPGRSPRHRSSKPWAIAHNPASTHRSPPQSAAGRSLRPGDRHGRPGRQRGVRAEHRGPRWPASRPTSSRVRRRVVFAGVGGYLVGAAVDQRRTSPETPAPSAHAGSRAHRHRGDLTGPSCACSRSRPLSRLGVLYVVVSEAGGAARSWCGWPIRSGPG